MRHFFFCYFCYFYFCQILSNSITKNNFVRSQKIAHGVKRQNNRKKVKKNELKMFVLVELKDTIRIAPELFNLKLNEAIKDEINRKLANKVENFRFNFDF